MIYRIAHEASVCLTVRADSEGEAKRLAKAALTDVLDYQHVFAAQGEGQPDPDAVIYLVDDAEATVEDVEEEDDDD